MEIPEGRGGGGKKKKRFEIKVWLSLIGISGRVLVFFSVTTH